MEDFSRMVDFFNENDAFCRANHIRLTKVEPGYAEAELEITASSLNAGNVVQGGAIFTLSDFCFAGAANAAGQKSVSLDCGIHFVRPGSGKKLRAVAREVSRGRRIGIYRVEVFDDAGKLVAYSTFTGFSSGGELPEKATR